jgi:hypothetical protein
MRYYPGLYLIKNVLLTLNTSIPFIADSVNRGISTAKGMRATCTIKLSINKDLKLRKRKRRDKQ